MNEEVNEYDTGECVTLLYSSGHLNVIIVPARQVS